MNKKNKNEFKFKIYFWGSVLFLSLISFLIGIIFSELENKFPLYFTNSIITTLFLVIITTLITIFIHELSHFLAFLYFRYDILLFILGPFSFYKSSNKWTVKFKFNSAIGIGGLVIPNIPKIRNNEDFKKIKTEYSKVMVIAPLVSAIQGLLSLFIIIFFLPNFNKNIQSTFFTILMTSLFNAIYINITSLITISGLLGDYKAYKLFKYTDTFAAYQLYTYLKLSTEKKNISEDCNILKNIILSELEQRYKNKILDSFTCLLVDIYIYEYLTHNISIPMKVVDYINYYIENIETFYSKLIFESYYVLFAHILIYLSEKDLQKSINLWRTIKNKFPKNKVANYYIVQIESKLNNNISKSFLCDKKNIHLSSLDPIVSFLDNYYEDEIFLNSK